MSKKDVYNAKIKNIENKIPDTSNWATNTTINAKINEVIKKIPNITNLAITTTTLTAIEIKIPNVSNLVKKFGCNTKISKTEKKNTNHDHDKYITTPKFNKLTTKRFAARIAQANLASQNDITAVVKKIDFDEILKKLNKNITSNKNELNELSEKVKAITKKRINDKFDK